MSEQQVNGSIKIGPEFFAGAFREYSNPVWSFVRELFQNAVDSKGCFAIDIQVNVTPSGDTAVTFVDNGQGMTRQIMTDVFLALGQSTKRGQNGVAGGFGVARNLTCFAQKSYYIHTQDVVVEGSGATFTIDKAEYRRGAKFVIVWAGDKAQALITEFKRLFCMAQWDGMVMLNGERQLTNLRKGTPRRTFEFGQVYSNRSFSNTLVIRKNGIPMSVRYSGYDGCLVLELTGSSLDTLTSNRDGLRSPYDGQLSNFMTSLSVDKRSALQNKNVNYRRYQGPEISVASQEAAAVAIGSLSGIEVSVDGPDNGPTGPAMASHATGTLVTRQVSHESIPVDKRIAVQTNFIVKNTTGMEVPAYYLPDSSEFSPYARSMARVWTACLIELHRLFKHAATFSVGFVFDEDNEAQHERTEHYGQVYYINPASVVSQKNTNARSFKKRFKLTERHRILADAVHEYTHGIGFQSHDEDFSTALTNNMGVVMANLKRFNKCFAAQVA